MLYREVMSGEMQYIHRNLRDDLSMTTRVFMGCIDIYGLASSLLMQPSAMAGVGTTRRFMRILT